MRKMFRKQVYLAAEQGRRLKAHAAATGLSEAEIIRRAIGRELEQAPPAAEGDWKEAWRQACGMWADYDEIDEIIAARRARRRGRRRRMQELMRAKATT